MLSAHYFANALLANLIAFIISKTNKCSATSEDDSAAFKTDSSMFHRALKLASAHSQQVEPEK